MTQTTLEQSEGKWVNELSWKRWWNNGAVHTSDYIKLYTGSRKYFNTYHAKFLLLYIVTFLLLHFRLEIKMEMYVEVRGYLW